MEGTNYTPDEVVQWKAKYGENNLRSVTIKTADGQEEEYVLRVPGRAELEAVGRHGANKDVSKANQVLITNCVLRGNTELFDKDGTVYAAVLDELSKLMRKAEATVKKL
ncbi:MAG: hypothetical protein K1X81_01880 [Bacteroidia bacterium]|nr:hypothetical protein [Bacteroidia bacterium]